MDAMLQLSERPEAAPEQPGPVAPRRTFLGTLQATSTRRALLLTALGGLLIAGVITALPIGLNNHLTGYAGTDPLSGIGAKGNAAFANAKAGSCLTWPDKNPDAAAVVDCKDDHRFEVAESVDMRTYPGTEYGPDAAPPSAARIQQISLEQCQPAVERYLGDKFDPNSRFTISMLWSGDKAWKQSGERRMLCGLQLPGADNQQIAFKGKVADLDQSKVWPAGTCLGIDPSTNQPTDAPVDCGAPHAMEVTGAVNLAEKFPGALPADADQDAFIKDACTRMTDAYLAPIQLRSTTLTLIYSTISLPSWNAGSHEVSCSIGATLGNGGWATLINPAKGPLLINGMPPVPPPDIPRGAAEHAAHPAAARHGGHDLLAVGDEQLAVHRHPAAAAARDAADAADAAPAAAAFRAEHPVAGTGGRGPGRTGARTRQRGASDGGRRRAAGGRGTPGPRRACDPPAA